MSNLDFVKYDQLTDKQLNEISCVVYELDKGFYQHFGNSKMDVCFNISRILLESNSDCGFGEGVLLNNKLIGFYSCFDRKEVIMRTSVSLKFLTANIINDKSKLITLRDKAQSFRSSLSPIPLDSFYLNKIGVFNEYRGGGIGRKIMTRFFLNAASKRYSLHVKKDNVSAIEFYRSLGFKVHENCLEYISMVKSNSRL